MKRLLLWMLFVTLIFCLFSCDRPLVKDPSGDDPQAPAQTQGEDAPPLISDTKGDEGKIVKISVDDAMDLTITPPIVHDLPTELLEKTGGASFDGYASFAGEIRTLESMVSGYAAAKNVVAGQVQSIRYSETGGFGAVLYDFLVTDVLMGELEAPCLITVVQSGGYVSVEGYRSAWGDKGLSEEDIARGYVGSNTLSFGDEFPEISDEYVLLLGAVKEDGDFKGAYSVRSSCAGKYHKNPETGLYERRNVEKNGYCDYYEYDRETGVIASSPEVPMSLETIQSRISAVLQNAE